MFIFVYFTEINDLFNVYNLKPPHVNMENMNYDQNFKCTVTVNLDNYTYANKQQGYDTKKDAIRKTYLLFGCAMAILDPNTGIFVLNCTHIYSAQRKWVHPLWKVTF